MEFLEMIRSQYGSTEKCAEKLGIPHEQFVRQLRTGSISFLNAIADNCRLSRQEVRWEFKFYREEIEA
jgi:hypothetical protein